jgi:hypothetical protein
MKRKRSARACSPRGPPHRPTGGGPVAQRWCSRICLTTPYICGTAAVAPGPQVNVERYAAFVPRRFAERLTEAEVTEQVLACSATGSSPDAVAVSVAGSRVPRRSSMQAHPGADGRPPTPVPAWSICHFIVAIDWWFLQGTAPSVELAWQGVAPWRHDPTADMLERDAGMVSGTWAVRPKPSLAVPSPSAAM